MKKDPPTPFRGRIDPSQPSLKGEASLSESSPFMGELEGVCSPPKGGWGVFFLLLTLFLISCSPSRPRGILSEEKMEDVLVDFHLAQGMSETQNEVPELARYKYIQAVFKKHRITEAEFDSSLVYYSGKAEDFTRIYENVVQRVQASAERLGLEATSSQDMFSSLTSEGDTANIWLGKNFCCVVANPVGCVYDFQLKADSTFRPGDKFIWRFKSQFVAQSMNNEAIALLCFSYDTDTTASVTELVRNRPDNELRYYPDKAIDSLALRSISGFIYLPLTKGIEPPQPLLVSDIMLIRMHKPAPADSLDAKKLQASPTEADTLAADTFAVQNTERLSPLQMRESQPKRKTIHVVKENPNPIHPERGIPQRTGRRKR